MASTYSAFNVYQETVGFTSMAISHNYYLFDPQISEQVLKQEFLLLNDYPGSYTALCRRGMELFDRSKQAQTLADRYGGWDRASIITTFISKSDVELDDYAFWYSLFLYSQLEESFGLGTNWECATVFLQHKGVLHEDREGVVMGNGMESLAVEWLRSLALTSIAQGQYLQLWRKFRPFSTSSHAGWLNTSAIESIAERLRGSCDIKDCGGSEIEVMLEGILRTLRLAISRGNNILILISG